MQLVAYGAQDTYLSGSPQVTFWKVVYRRHTNFSMESIEQVFNGATDWGRKVTATISRNGDLIHRAYLRVVLPAVTVAPGWAFRWLNYVGHALVKSIEIEIGGQRIDKHYGDWLHIWNELTQPAGKALGYANMVGNVPELTNVVKNLGTNSSSMTVPSKVLYIPLEFWWNTNPGLALPLIALQYHEVKINLEINAKENCCWIGKEGSTPGQFATNTQGSGVTVPPLQAASLMVDFTYLDSDERRRYAQSAHEYLLWQCQHTGEETTTSDHYKAKLNFNHPCRELIWVVQPEDLVGDSTRRGKEWFNYTDDFEVTDATEDDELAFPNAVDGMPATALGGLGAGGANPVQSARLLLNGHERMSEREGFYFNVIQPYQHHENVPKKGINVYSFALRPEEHQPSGTCNMSRIDNATLDLKLTTKTVRHNNVSRTAKVRVYAVNYNVLRIMSGMGGLAYSN